MVFDLAKGNKLSQLSLGTPDAVDLRGCLLHLDDLGCLGAAVGVGADALVLVLLNDFIDLILQAGHGHSKLLFLLLHLDVLALQVGRLGHGYLLLVLLVNDLLVLVIYFLLLLIKHPLLSPISLDHQSLLLSLLADDLFFVATWLDRIAGHSWNERVNQATSIVQVNLGVENA